MRWFGLSCRSSPSGGDKDDRDATLKIDKFVIQPMSNKDMVRLQAALLHLNYSLLYALVLFLRWYYELC